MEPGLSGLAKQWVWAASWLCAAIGCLLAGWLANRPWLASLSLLGIIAPLTPTSWRDDG